MRSPRPAAALAAAAVLAALLAGCTSLLPTASTATATPPDAGPRATVEPQPPVPTDDTPPSLVPTPPTDQGEAPPADWSDEELVGACKEAWVATGASIDWNVYSSDATIEARGAEWYVAFAASDGSKSLECLVSGTPSQASVTTVT